MSRRACVIGSGAREHAIALALSRSADVLVTPGNDAMEGPSIKVSSLPATSIDADLFVVGPDQQVVDGLADDLRAQGRLVVAPGRAAARLEGSKAFMKDVLSAAGVATAAYGVFDDVRAATKFIEAMRGTVVVKTDGLAAGKGVLVTDDLNEAVADVQAKLSGESFGDAGRRVVVEQGLVGLECSLTVLVDGATAEPMAPARDHKRLGDGDVGPNTGGMGAFSPVPGVDDALVEVIMDKAVHPTLAELARRGIDYRGVLYAGVMVTDDGPFVLEYNVRLGDPEAQVLLPRLADDPFDLFMGVANGTMQGAPRFIPDAAVTVVLAAQGYPSAPVPGATIRGLGLDGQLEDRHDGVFVFHAGTRRTGDGFEVAGGRVLSVTALGPTLAVARSRAYDAVSTITFDGRQVRRDIAVSADEAAA